jgi:hypothetical protein
MKRARLKGCRGLGKGPCWGNATLVPSRGCHRPNWPPRAGRHSSQAGLSSVDFQTRRIADTPESAEREAALEVGLEICAAANALTNFAMPVFRSIGAMSLQFEFVARGSLPAMHLASEPRNHGRLFRVAV